MFRALALACSLAPGAGLAQELAHDVETFTLLATDSPPGPWTGIYAPIAANRIDAGAVAAHRGSFGIRAIDAVGTGNADTEIRLFYNLTARTGDTHLRAWVRLATSNGLGRLVIIQVSSVNTALLDFIVPGTGGVELGGFTSTGYVFSAPGPSVSDGGWHLVEVSLLGVGTMSGRMVGWVDGRDAGVSARNWQGYSYDNIGIGEPWSSDRSFIGAIDFDDVRISTRPHASRLGVEALGTIPAGACRPLRISLHDSNGNLARAPYGFDAGVWATGGPLTIAGDPGCLLPATTADFAPDASTALVYVRGTSPASVLVESAYEDLLSGSAPLIVSGFVDAGAGDGGSAVADGGVDGGAADAGQDGGAGDAGAGTLPAVDGGSPMYEAPFEASVGCACAEVPGALAALLLLCVFARRRRSA